MASPDQTTGAITKQCCILVGGLGTRLGELTRESPKPLLPVGGTPFLEVLIREAIRRGFDDILLLAGFKSAAMQEFVNDLQSRLPQKTRISVSIEPEPLGTGGALLHARDQLHDSFLLLNGDTWFDFNWLDLLELAGQSNALAIRHVDNADRHETVRLACGERVMQIVPRTVGSKAALVNGGVYVFRKSVIDGFPRQFSIESDLLPKLVEKSLLRGREYDGFFVDIGIPQTLKRAQTEVPAQRRRPAIFFDRDGVLNHDDNYVGSVERFRWIDGAKQAVRLANDLGYYVFVVTNQAGVGRGFYDEAAVESLHQWMNDQLREDGAYVDDWRFCPYHPDAALERYRSNHPWRKPAPGMLIDLLETWPVDVEQSILIGDKEGDCAAARAAQIPALLFKGGNLYDFLVDRLSLQHQTTEKCFE